MTKGDVVMKDSIMELEILLDYLINHNKEHADEVLVLAEKAVALGKISVRDDLLNGVEAMNKSNEYLKCALKGLRNE